MKSLRTHKVSLHPSSAGHLPFAQMGQQPLASGQELAMQFWHADPTEQTPREVSRDYEVIGYVIEGRAELHADDQAIVLNPGDSWVVPTGALHTYRILEPLTAIRVIHPPTRHI